MSSGWILSPQLYLDPSEVQGQSTRPKLLLVMTPNRLIELEFIVEAQGQQPLGRGGEGSSGQEGTSKHIYITLYTIANNRIQQ